MAGPGAHVVLAERALPFIPGKDERQFMVGNLFPDIRYLKVIDRKTTHPKGVKLPDVLGEADAFKAGMLLHNLIDDAREEYVRKQGVYDRVPHTYVGSVALKLCEDVVLYPRSRRWPEHRRYLRGVLPQQREFAIADDKIQTWHRILDTYFSSIPHNGAAKLIALLGFDGNQAKEITALTGTIQKTGIVEEYIGNFYNNLERILRSHR